MSQVEQSISGILLELAKGRHALFDRTDAYTATFQIGYWVSHVIRIGSPELIAGLGPGPAMRQCTLTIWPSDDRQSRPHRSLAETGGIIALARSLDVGVDVVRVVR
jgi:hypothetical protein